jgi:hypothetical protein
MKVTKENVISIRDYGGSRYSIERNARFLGSLLDDLDMLNSLTKPHKLYVNYDDKHTEYSPERTEPSPDYYGYFTLRWENKPSEKVGDYMTLEELDGVLCALSDFAEKTLPRLENG